MKFNERVKMFMNEKKMTQKQLAEKTGITEASMSKYLNGERTPRIDVVANLSKALGVTTDDLIGNEVEDAPSFAKRKVLLARGLENMSEKEKKMLIAYILKS
ncbi:MAG TPA: transcriptional regulator [Firmicutes bacterium]|nr:transcriptional regulator [Bacillota bacterium]